MDAQTSGQADARAIAIIAAGAASFGTVADPARGAIVSGADDTTLSTHEDASHPTLHAVGSLGGQRCQSHEVRVPPGAESIGIWNVKLAERGIQVSE